MKTFKTEFMEFHAMQSMSSFVFCLLCTQGSTFRLHNVLFVCIIRHEMARDTNCFIIASNFILFIRNKQINKRNI